MEYTLPQQPKTVFSFTQKVMLSFAMGEEQTLAELVRVKQSRIGFRDVLSIFFRVNKKIIHTSSRPLIPNLEDLPSPGGHLVKDNRTEYHFSIMAEKTLHTL